MCEALVKRLRGLPVESFTFEIMNAMHEAADAIEELQDRVAASEATIKRQSDIIKAKDRDLRRAIDAKPQWIPVAERLPKKMVLAHGRDGDIRSLEYSFTKKWWEDDDGYYCDTNYVTHWMPLPEPPKEETCTKN